FRLYKAEVIAQGSGYSVYRELLYQIRHFLEGIFDNVLSPKDASIMKAILLGSKSGLDEDSKQLFQKSGIAHIFAISGLHITMLGMGLYHILRRLWIPQPLCAVVSVGVMVAYGDLVGMSSSAYRAVVMFGLQLVAQMLRRTYDMLTALALAAILILMEEPRYLYHSGFQLSFGAILGIGCLSEIVKPVRRKVLEPFCVSISIFLVHFPIMLSVYYEFPVYSFLLNLVIIPAMSVLMAAGLICLGAGSLSAVFGFGLAKLAGRVCHMLLAGFEGLCVLSLRLPFANWVVGRPDTWRIYVFCAVVLFLYAAHRYGAFLSKQTSRESLSSQHTDNALFTFDAEGAARGQRELTVGLPALVKFAAVLSAVILISDNPVDGVSMTFLDVGQGDCIWIESAGGEQFLVDGGSTSKSKTGRYTILPFLKYKGVSALDAVFLTHLDSDHISGIMEMLEGSGQVLDINIKRLCISDAVIEDEPYEKLKSLCERRQIPIYRLKAGDSIEACGLRFEVLHPSAGYEAASRNASSLVMKLKAGTVTALLTGDVEADGEQAAAGQLLRQNDFAGIDIYKAAHHGSKYSNTEALLSQIQPETAVISCGESNRYGHPHPETVERLEQTGSGIWMTKNTGAITIHIKKGCYTIETFLKNDQKK
ncbi:MAG: competence protein ComEC family protein, partial [Lachnospiraceae bacterium]|nr:competence protein ComEC family protein [Lachnospiraceae bacterium]